MSDFILEILEPVVNIVEVETSILDNVIDNITIETFNTNNIEIVNTEKILVSDLPYGYPINNTTGDLPATRVSGIMDLISSSAISEIDGGTP